MTWGLLTPSLTGPQGPAGKGGLLCSCQSGSSPCLTSRVKYSLLVAKNGSLFTCYYVGLRAHTHTHPCLPLPEIDEQGEGQLCRGLPEPPVLLILMAVLLVPLTTCTLLF